MLSMLRLLGIAAVLFSVCLINAPTSVEANLSLAFKALKIAKHSNPANCTVGNTTYAHGQTFKLDCKTQCVCENGRHACSSLCPKEQLPAPEDTISCRSPRLVEVPGHCCKMWLCENPTADVYATCHNSSSSPWTPCSRSCGLGIATRHTSTTTGCRQLSNMRLCETRKCPPTSTVQSQSPPSSSSSSGAVSLAEPTQRSRSRSHYNYNNNNNEDIYERWPQQEEQQEKQQHQHKQHKLPANAKKQLHHGHGSWPKKPAQREQHEQQPQHMDLKEPLMEHRIRKGHECRSIQRLGPARIRLDKCVSKKLYRPKLCGQCHQHSLKCCVPSVSTTIQVELLCPLIGTNDPNHYVVEQLQRQQQQHRRHRPRQQHENNMAPSSQDYSDSEHDDDTGEELEPPTLTLWDTVSLEPLDQEYLQSHQIQIENKFIAVEWIQKCECSKHADNCSASSGNNNNDSNDDDPMNGNNNNNKYQFFNPNNKEDDSSSNNNIHDKNNNRDHNIIGNNKNNNNNKRYNTNNKIDDDNNSNNNNDEMDIKTTAEIVGDSVEVAADNAEAPSTDAVHADDEGDGDGMPDDAADDSDEWQPDIIPYPRMSMKVVATSTAATTAASTRNTKAQQRLNNAGDIDVVDGGSNNNNYENNSNYENNNKYDNNNNNYENNNNYGNNNYDNNNNNYGNNNYENNNNNYDNNNYENTNNKNNKYDNNNNNKITQTNRITTKEHHHHYHHHQQQRQQLQQQKQQQQHHHYHQQRL